MRMILIMLLLLETSACAASVAVKVRDGSNYEDGDVVQVFTDHHIQALHAEVITNPWKAPMDENKLRPNDSTSRFWCEKVYEYRFERVSTNQVIRFNQWTGTSDLLSDVANRNGEYIFVELYIQRRKNEGYPLFGEPGREVWFGGNRSITPEVLDTIWEEIEAKTEYKRVDHTLFPHTDLEKKHFLILPIENLSEADAEAIDSPLFEMLEPGDTKTPKVLMKSRYKINYRALLANNPEIIDMILDQDTPVDLRSFQPIPIKNLAMDKVSDPVISFAESREQ